MKRIPLNQNAFTLVDDDDYENLSKYKWYCSAQGYAVRNLGQGKQMRMHRQIINAPNGFETDHINGDKLDNRKLNLRICTHSENCYNSQKRSDNTSGYKGVVYHREAGKWRARISKKGKRKHVGLFHTAEEAARAYDDAAIKLHGEFARPNLKG